jgi:cell division septation protein DedD
MIQRMHWRGRLAGLLILWCVTGALAEPPQAPLQSGTGAADAPSLPQAAYVVQISAQRSEDDAMASFQALQVRYPALLGNREPMVRRIQIGDRGPYYRVGIGPFATTQAAAQVCTELRTAGAACLVARW